MYELRRRYTGEYVILNENDDSNALNFRISLDNKPGIHLFPKVQDLCDFLKNDYRIKHMYLPYLHSYSAFVMELESLEPDYVKDKLLHILIAE